MIMVKMFDGACAQCLMVCVFNAHAQCLMVLVLNDNTA
jgi:hypothetical protein